MPTAKTSVLTGWYGHALGGSPPTKMDPTAMSTSTYLKERSRA